MSSRELSTTTFSTPAQFRTLQREQKQNLQAAAAMQLATMVLLEKALDTNLDDDAHALVNAAYFQASEMKTTFDRLAEQIDTATLLDANHD